MLTCNHRPVVAFHCIIRKSYTQRMREYGIERCARDNSIRLVVNRRLEDRIRELSERAVEAREEDQRELILAELRAALREVNERVKKNAVLKLVELDDFRERRG
jgi:hypothetical protein